MTPSEAPALGLRELEQDRDRVAEAAEVDQGLDLALTHAQGATVTAAEDAPSVLAFDVKTDTDQTKPMTYNTATTKRMRQQESLILEMEATSVRRRMQTTRDQTSHKIVALKEIIEQMKRRSEENKPKDWYINYGKPISKRKLIKVARPTSRGVMI